MKIKESVDGKLITLSTALDTRAKVLHLCYFVVLFVSGTYSLRLVLEGFDNILALVIGGLFGSLTYTGAYRFANKAVTTEQILVTGGALTLIRKGIVMSTKRVFDVQKISGLRHLAQPTLTKHPLAGDVYDYFGFQTEQQVINDMHGDNQLAFDYAGKTIKFGNNIPSWDFEELQSILLIITEKDLTVAEKEDDMFL